MGFNCLLYIFHFKMHPYYHDSFPRLRGGHVRLRYGSRLWWRRLAAPRRRGPSGLALWSYGVGSPLSLQHSVVRGWHLGISWDRDISRVVCVFFEFTQMGCENHWSRLHPSPSYVDVSAFLSFVAWFQWFFESQEMHTIATETGSPCVFGEIATGHVRTGYVGTQWKQYCRSCYYTTCIHSCFFRNLLQMPQIGISFLPPTKKLRAPIKTIGNKPFQKPRRGSDGFTSLRFLAQQAALLYLRLGQDLDSPVHGEGEAVEAVAIKNGAGEMSYQLIRRISHYLRGFIHPRWCRISSINSMKSMWNEYNTSKREETNKHVFF